MAKRPIPTPAQLRQLISYDPDTGVLTWLPRTADFFTDGGHSAGHRAANWNARYAGKPALNAFSTHGYCRGSIFGRNFSGHRVAWAIYHGEWPDGEIDHINHNIRDNRIANLRLVDRLENMKNVSFRRDNKSGATGVWWRKDIGKWLAHIGAGPRRRNLGYFENFVDAVAARKKAERELNYHVNHGAI